MNFNKKESNNYKSLELFRIQVDNIKNNQIVKY